MMLPSSKEVSVAPAVCLVAWDCRSSGSEPVAHRTAGRLESRWLCSRASFVPEGIALWVPSFQSLWDRIWEERYPVRFPSLH